MKESQNQALSYNEGGNFVDLTGREPWGRKIVGMAQPDQAGYDERPRTMSRLETAFRSRNPEFQDGIGDGDWTSAKWSSNV